MASPKVNRVASPETPAVIQSGETRKYGRPLLEALTVSVLADRTAHTKV